MSLDRLDYETHLRHYSHLLNARSPEDIAHAERRAQYIHSLIVMDGLRDLMTRSIEFQRELANENARYYMLYGAGRRLNMMWYAYRNIIFTATPERVDPIPHEEANNLTRDLNILYMNLRGVLDNFAWCYLFEKETEASTSIKPQKVSLFFPPLSTFDSFVAVAQALEAHRAWYDDVRTRRDPVAHRIPLHVPPAIVTPEEAEVYHEAFDEFLKKAGQLDFEASGEAFVRMDEIGKFVPYFVHDPEDGIVPIYPTVPTDMVHLIRIGEIIRESLC